MKEFLRSINSDLKKRITVVNNNEEKTYDSLCDMPLNDRMEYVFMAMNAFDDTDMTPEQIALIRQNVKGMMMRQALSQNCR